MQEMHPDVGYIPGEENVVSDFLSRYQGMDENAHQVACTNLTHINGVGVDSVDLSWPTILGAQRLSPMMRSAAELMKQQNHKFGDAPVYFPKLKQNITWMPNSPCVAVIPRPRKGAITPEGPLPIIPPNIREGILREAHNSEIGGHNGLFRTAETLKRIVWWPKMEEDIQLHIQKCNTCGANPTRKKQRQGPLQPLPVPSRPHERIHVDLFGPLKTSDKGNKYVLVWTDALTRMTKLKAIPDKSAATVAEAILDLVYVTGVPKQIHSDQGLEFCNELLQNIYRALDINHTTTTPYHPQANAAAERFNRTMVSFLTKAIADADRSTLDWELYLGPLALSYNSGVNRSTRMSPYYATFGFDPTLPMWQGLEEQPVKSHTYAEALTKMHHAQGRARRICQENSREEQKRATQLRDDKDYPEFKPLDKVWIHVNAKLGPNPKLAQSSEPGMVVETLSRNVYKVLRYNRRRKKRTTLNVSHLRHRTAQNDADDHFKEVIEGEINRKEPETEEELQEEEEATQEEEQEQEQDQEQEEEEDDTSVNGEESDQRANNNPRRSARIRAQASQVNDAAMQQIAHLIPDEAKHLPFLQAVAYIPHEKMDYYMVLDLVQKGWIIGLNTGIGNQGNQEVQGQRQRPPTATRGRGELALRRLSNFNNAGEAETSATTRRTRTAKAIKNIKKIGPKIKNKVLSNKKKEKINGNPETERGRLQRGNGSPTAAHHMQQSGNGSRTAEVPFPQELTFD